MQIIIIVIIVIIVIGIISKIVQFISDYWKIMIGAVILIAALAGMILFVHRRYSLAGYPIWPIWGIVFFLAAFDFMCFIYYLLCKRKLIRILEKAADEAEEINNKDIEMNEEVRRQISEVMAEMGMGTDLDILDKLDFNDIIALNDKKKKLKDKLVQYKITYPNVQVINKAIIPSEDQKIFKEALRSLIDTKEIVIEASNLIKDEANNSVDRKLYKTTLECPNPSNMLPTIRLEID